MQGLTVEMWYYNEHHAAHTRYCKSQTVGWGTRFKDRVLKKTQCKNGMCISKQNSIPMPV